MKTLETETYQFLRTTKSARQWQRLGLKRRAGVATPLFSLHSKNSVGIGEIPDLKLFIHWCQKVGFSLIQLLPLNDVGFNFTPYDATSTFALEPMYLSVQELKGVDIRPYQEKITALRKKFPLGGLYIDYNIKKEKLALFFEIYSNTSLRGSAFSYVIPAKAGIHIEDGSPLKACGDDRNRQIASGASLPRNDDKNPSSFLNFIHQNAFWLPDYALFKVLKEIHNESCWESWPQEFKNRDQVALTRIKTEYANRIQFYEWLQWHLAMQMEGVKKYGQDRRVFLMGDMPFLVSRDSADVWARQNYFRLDLAAGAPPDAYIAKGQRWGMPPYRWQTIEADGFRHIKEKLKWSEKFYDLFRIDHAVGMFRLWTIPVTEPLENGGLHGHFDPENEGEWEAHGRKLFSVLVENTGMLACAEDLGVIPECSAKVLGEFGIPGMEIQRWMKDWGKTYDFLPPDVYRPAAVSMLGTHDSTSFQGWWQFDAGTVDEDMMKRKFQNHGLDSGKLFPRLFDLNTSGHGRLRWHKEIATDTLFLEKIGRRAADVPDLLDLYLGSYGEKEKFLKFIGLNNDAETATPGLVQKAVQKASEVKSIFSVHLLQDWLAMNPPFERDAWNYRINFPGMINKENWTLAIPISLEKMMEIPVNTKIKEVNHNSGRI